MVSNVQIYLQIQRFVTIETIKKCATYFEGSFKIYILDRCAEMFLVTMTLFQCTCLPPLSGKHLLSFHNTTHTSLPQ